MGVALEINDLTKNFGGTVALSDFSATVYSSSVTCLVGPNGAGKSTLFNIISGFVMPDSGEVLVRGKSICGLQPHRIAQLGVARTFQDLRLIKELSVFDNVLLALRQKREESLFSALMLRNPLKDSEEMEISKVLALLKYFGIEDTLNYFARDLSYGQQKMLTICCCVALGGNILLLDEPFAGIQPKLIGKVQEIVREQAEAFNKSVLVVDHDLEAIRDLGEHCIALAEGLKIGEGTTSEVLGSMAFINSYMR